VVFTFDSVNGSVMLNLATNSHSILLIIIVTRSDKQGLIAHDRKSNFFHTNTKLHECTIRFQCQTWPVITGLLLLAAYSWPSGDLYEQSGVFMAPWGPVVSCVCFSSLVVLDKDLWC